MVTIRVEKLLQNAFVNQESTRARRTTTDFVFGNYKLGMYSVASSLFRAISKKINCCPDILEIKGSLTSFSSYFWTRMHLCRNELTICIALLEGHSVKRF